MFGFGALGSLALGEIPQLPSVVSKSSSFQMEKAGSLLKSNRVQLEANSLLSKSNLFQMEETTLHFLKSNTFQIEGRAGVIQDNAPQIENNQGMRFNQTALIEKLVSSRAINDTFGAEAWASPPFDNLSTIENIASVQVNTTFTLETFLAFISANMGVPVEALRGVLIDSIAQIEASGLRNFAINSTFVVESLSSPRQRSTFPAEKLSTTQADGVLKLENIAVMAGKDFLANVESLQQVGVQDNSFSIESFRTITSDNTAALEALRVFNPLNYDSLVQIEFTSITPPTPVPVILAKTIVTSYNGKTVVSQYKVVTQIVTMRSKTKVE